MYSIVATDYGCIEFYWVSFLFVSLQFKDINFMKAAKSRKIYQENVQTLH